MRYLAHKYLHRIFQITLVSSILAGSSLAQQPGTQIAYLLSLDETGWRSCRISITIENNRQEHLVFALPEWLPGTTARANAGINIQNLKIEGAQNKLLAHEQLSVNRWLVDTREQSVLRVTYDVLMQESEMPPHKLDARGALINGGLVFMFIENLRDLPVFVRLNVPEAWKVATGLRPTVYLNEFIADNYEELIDSPILVGDFQDFYFRHLDKTINVVITNFNNQQIDRFLGTMRKIVRTQSNIFSSLPFESYIFLCEFLPPSQTPRAAGFRNSCVLQCPVRATSQDLNDFAPQMAREFFRIWNGRRLRPATARLGDDTWLPHTDLLWFTEGFTLYYADLTMVRGKIWSEAEFLEQVSRRVASLKENPLNSKMTACDASLAAGERDVAAVTGLFENRGYLLALVLDLKIRQATNNQKSLDDVMQLLDWWFAKDSKSVSQADILKAVNAIHQSDCHLFFERFINGTQALPLDDLFRFVGLDLQLTRSATADLGELPGLSRKNLVIKINENSLLARAGLEKGTQILAVDSIKTAAPEDFLAAVAGLKENSEVQLTVIKNKVQSAVLLKTGQKYRYRATLASPADLAPAQIQNRQTWLQNAGTNP